ncbi:MAG: helix-turn-helix transcriptional regulator, partial [Clostridia bacterium]|nr:helix-turn-helix transcriptional regulator [Clostridia bacterium]
GLKQEELASKLGVKQSTVSLWETGERKPDIIMIKRIAQVLECSTDDLLATIEMKEVQNDE